VPLRATSVAARRLCGHGHFVFGCHHCLPRVTELPVRSCSAGLLASPTHAAIRTSVGRRVRRWRTFVDAWSTLSTRSRTLMRIAAVGAG
jgi:hypothetical protein